MAGRDGTGPTGQGPLTGRGMGVCAPTSNPVGNTGYFGRGRGCGMGLGRGFRRATNLNVYQDNGQDLKAEREFLAARLAELDKQIYEKK